MLTKKGAPINSRQQKGLTIAQLNGMVQRIDANAYKVKSQSGNGIYDVLAAELGWKCSCPDFAFRLQKCKHVFAIEFSLTLRKTVVVKRIEQITNTANCIFCSSDRIVKDGIRNNKYGDIQKFNCKACRHYFTINLGFERMRAKPEIITSAMQLYFTGESLRNVKKFLKMQGISKSHIAIYKWIKKYVSLMNNYLEQITPAVSDTWRADELYLKVRGNMKYLFALMDYETRFWIAQEVADTKFTHNARNLFKQGKKLTGKKPSLLITDGLPAYRDAFDKEYFSLKNPRPKHQYTIRISGDMNNNKVAGITIEGKDKWKTIIENTSKNNRNI